MREGQNPKFNFVFFYGPFYAMVQPYFLPTDSVLAEWKITQNMVLLGVESNKAEWFGQIRPPKTDIQLDMAPHRGQTKP